MIHDSSCRYGGTHDLSDMIVGLSDMFMNLSDMFDRSIQSQNHVYTPIRPRHHGKDHSHVSPFITQSLLTGQTELCGSGAPPPPV
jgi:hypothetical protein